MTSVIANTVVNHQMVDYWQSPIGWIEVTSVDNGIEGQALSSLYFRDKLPPSDHMNTTPCSFNRLVISQLQEYFSGQRTQFDLPLAMPGTEFQQQVWKALQTIDYGQTTSYQSLAHQIGRNKAIRAVGAANGRNPISIIVPCHRVIGSNGSLTGYAGGLERKAWLLAHEGAL